MAIAAGGGHPVHAQIHCELSEQKKGRQQRGPEQVFPPREGDGESGVGKSGRGAGWGAIVWEG